MMFSFLILFGLLLIIVGLSGEKQVVKKYLKMKEDL